MPEIEITAEQFAAYERVRNTDVVNMFVLETAAKLSGLSRTQCEVIMLNYSALRRRYGIDIDVEINVEIIPLRWYARPRGTIGFVALLNEDTRGRYFKVYCDIVPGHTETTAELDARLIAEWGSPVLDEPLARLLAPMCADREYRY